MSKRRPKAAISDLLRDTIAKSGIPLLVLERETGVSRASIRRFVEGRQFLRLDMADQLATHLGLRLTLDRDGKAATLSPVNLTRAMLAQRKTERTTE